MVLWNSKCGGYRKYVNGRIISFSCLYYRQRIYI